MELSFVRSEEQMRTQVELQPTDVERLKKQADEFDRQVRQPVLEGARERQDQANKRLDGKRNCKAFDPRIKPGALVMVRDQNRKSKWSPALIGPFLVNRQSKRALTFYLENFSKKKSSILPRPFPVHHVRKSRSFKKRKLVRKAAQKSPYSY